MLTDRQVAEASTPSPEPELATPQKRKRTDEGPLEPTNGAWRPRTEAQRTVNDDSSESGDSERYQHWQPKEQRERQAHQEPLPESR